MSRTLCIVGAGQVGSVALEHFKSAEDESYDHFLFVEEDGFFRRRKVEDTEVIALSDALRRHRSDDWFVALSPGRRNMPRARVFEHLREFPEIKFTSLIHRTANISNSASLGTNLLILEGVVVQTHALIADNVTLWSGAHVGHHSMIGESSFVSSGAVIGGSSQIGQRTFIGINASVVDGISLGNASFVSAGGVASRDSADFSFFD